MAEEGGDSSGSIYAAVIKAVDKVSEPIKGIMETIKALVGVEEEADHTEARVHHKGAVEAHHHAHAFHALSAHVRLLRGHFVNLSGTIGEFGRSFSELVPAIAGLGAAGSLVGLVETVEHTSEAFSQLQSTAAQAGVSVQTFAALSLAAKENDVPVDALRSSLFNLSKIMGGAVNGSNKKAAALFAHLGIALKDAHGNALSAAQVLPQLADAFQHTQSATMRAQMAQVLFGGRMGAQLLPILLKGSAGLKDYAEQYKKVGYVPTGNAAQQLESFHSSWAKLTTAVDGFQMEIGTKLAPALQPVIDLVTQWVATNRDWIATGISHAVGELTGWLRQLNIHRVVHEMDGWITNIRTVVDALGGAKTIVAGVAFVMASPLLHAVASAIEIFGGLRKIIVGFNALVLANPFVAIGAAVALVAYEIYEHWDWVKKQLGAIWQWFSHTTWGQSVIASAHRLVRVVRVIQAHWAPLQAFFTGLWGSVTAAFHAAWGAIAPIVQRIENTVGWVEHSWVGRRLGLAGSPGQPGKPGANGVDGMPAAARAPMPPGPHRTGRGGAPVSVLGKVETTITFRNAPPGTRVETKSSGAAADPYLDVGYAMPMGG